MPEMPILASAQFTDTAEVKTRPTVVLLRVWKCCGKCVTSNLKMEVIPLSKSEGAVKDSVIKLNYIFTYQKK